jgi:Mn-dependent DtxR family transcriptional regulator
VAANAKPLTINAEDYLERIHELIEMKGYARVSDIAAMLSLTRPTVSIMVQRLSRDGYIAEVARRIRTRHVLLTEFLGMLGLDRTVVSRDVEGIEHHVSPETLEKLERLVEHWKEHPARLRAALESKPAANPKRSVTKS